jgi:hypothetical protein
VLVIRVQMERFGTRFDCSPRLCGKFFRVAGERWVISISIQGCLQKKLFVVCHRGISCPKKVHVKLNSRPT